MMRQAPRGMRLHIGLFGRRNVGKSSLLNALTRQDVAIVSAQAGTTTDPVEKPMELLPIGPVLFIDTAGIDDVGALGTQRVEKTEKVFQRVDLGVVVARADAWGEFEEEIVVQLSKYGAGVIVVLNQTDLVPPNPELTSRLSARKIPWVATAAPRGQGIGELREALIRTAPEDFINTPSLVGDLVPPGELAMLVVPIDMEAPKGRLILPQVQTIRDLLDSDACAMVVKDRELRTALARLKSPPALVVTDSQAFLKVDGDTPAAIPMTSFSILFARYRGDLPAFVKGAKAIDRLESGDRILVCEACAHHPIGDDIGRVKIPRWLRQYTGCNLEFIHRQGHDFPRDLSPYSLVIHCGSCVLNRREVLSRTLHCREQGTPITNYGVAIAYTLGICQRALAPFPAASLALTED